MTEGQTWLERLVSHPAAKAIGLGGDAVVLSGAVATGVVVVWGLINNDAVLRLTLAIAIVVVWVVFLWWRLRSATSRVMALREDVERLQRQLAGQVPRFDQVRPEIAEIRQRVDRTETAIAGIAEDLGSVRERVEAVEVASTMNVGLSSPDTEQQEILREVSRAVVESFERFEYDNQHGTDKAGAAARAALSIAVARAAEIKDDLARQAVMEYREVFDETPPGYGPGQYGRRGADPNQMEILRRAQREAIVAIGDALRSI